ncbi:receptor-type tyrosine-protein phosphatase N2-like, partial [Pseudochaenichthys georgianus]|uniref:receptor-type tyrosine-protein phosphatase N2-like n=1 Tax=Pseudochaenichthys georgianus TaxID=52239 RepID=UPI00146DE92E
LTWQDDLTQQVISRELSKLRTVPLRHQTSAQSPLNAFSGSRDLKLSRTMKQYLSGLGFLPEGQTGSQRANVQNEDVKSDGDLEPSRSKPKHSWKETSVFSHQKEAGRPPITNVFTHTGEGKHPKLSPSYANRDPGRNALLTSHLERLLSEVPSTRQGNEKLHYINYIRPASSNQAASQVAFTSKSQRPHPDRLLFKASSNPPAAKEPLGAVDERFIQNVVNQFGRHSVHFESLMGTDLEHLAGVIAGALTQEKEGRPGPETGSDPAESRPVVALLKESQDRKQEHLKKEDTARPKEPGQQRAGADKEPVDKHAAFFSKLLDYLNMEPFNDAPQVNVGAPASLRKTVGQENVQSRTTLGQLPAALHLQEKPQQQQQQPPQPHEEEPQKMKEVKVKTQLVHVAVKEFSSRGKDRHFGYIITGSDSLTSSQGSELMARLTEKLNLRVSDLTQLS